MAREEGYDNSFNPSKYITLPDDKVFLMRCLHKFYSTLNGHDKLKILDYGCGPSLENEISAVSKAAEITMADYCKPNRDHVKEWLQGKAKHDLSVYLKHLQPDIRDDRDLERAVAAEAEKELKKKIKAVVWCDFTKDRPIEEGHEGPYDVVMALWCMGHAAGNAEEYATNLKRVLSLVRVEGILVMSSYTNKEKGGINHYYMGKRRLSVYCMTTETLCDILLDLGLVDVKLQKVTSNQEGFNVTFITAKKI